VGFIAPAPASAEPAEKLKIMALIILINLKNTQGPKIQKNKIKKIIWSALDGLVFGISLE